MASHPLMTAQVMSNNIVVNTVDTALILQKDFMVSDSYNEWPLGGFNSIFNHLKAPTLYHSRSMT